MSARREVPKLCDVPDGVLTRVEWVLRGGAHEHGGPGSEPAGAASFGWVFTVTLDAGAVMARLRPHRARRCVWVSLPGVRAELARRREVQP